MLAWVVIDRHQPRHSAPIPSSVRTLFLRIEFSDSLSRSLLPLSFRSFCQERFTTPFHSVTSALFLKTAGCTPSLPILVHPQRPVRRELTLRPIPFLFKPLRTLLHFFALSKNSTLLFSSDSALFAKKPPGWGEGGFED